MEEKKQSWFIISCGCNVDVRVWHFLRSISISEVFKKNIKKKKNQQTFFSLCVVRGGKRGTFKALYV